MRNKSNLYIVLVIIIVVVVGVLVACRSEEPAVEPTDKTAATEESNTPTMIAEDVTELKIEDLQVGDGAEAKSGDTVSVHYTGWLTDGTKFDSSVDRGTPFEFSLGAGQVIQGWDQGVVGMKVGGKRKLTIPPAMGYGDTGAGAIIGPGATLVFEVELLEVK